MSEVTFDFAGRSAIVTGAGRGIGLELARIFATSGAKTYLVDVDRDVVEAAAAEVGGIGLQADVASTEDVERVVRTLVPVSVRARDESGLAVGDGTYENKVSAMFAELPVEIEEAAIVDGCSLFGAFIKMAIPL